MTALSFVDSNILVYTNDRSASAKRDQAQELIHKLLRNKAGALSLQVLQEYFAVATRKLGISAAGARRRVELLNRLDVVILGVSDLLAAIDLHRLHGLSIWDTLIVRAALKAGCGVLYSEDLQDGRRFDGLEVVNPFTAAEG